MLAILILISALLLGFAVVRRLPLTLFWPESTALAAVIGLLFASWIPFLAVAAVGYDIGLWLAVLLTLVLAAALWRPPTYLREEPLHFKERSGYALWFLLTIGSVWLFAWAYQTHYLQIRPDGWYSSGDTWGDIALHLTLASNFAHQVGRLSLASPIFHGTQLTYPFLWDFLAGMLVRGGWTWQWALGIPSFLLAIAFVQLLFFAAYRLAKRASAGFLVVVTFIFAGSAGGVLAFWRDFRASGQGIGAFFNHLPADYSHIDTRGLHFTNALVSLILPQRGILLGMAVFLAVIMLLRAAWEDEKDGPLWLAALLIGLLPLVHVHTFLVAELTLIVLALTRGFREPWLGAILLSIAIAAPQVGWQLLHTPVGHFAHFFTGWMRSSNESLWLTWARNFGLILPLFVVTAIQIWRRGSSFWGWLALVAALIFALTNLVILQPNAYDNIKLIIYWYMIAAILVMTWLSRYPLVAWILAALIAAPGILSLRYDAGRSYALISNAGVASAKQVAQTLPAGARLLTADNHNHPLTMLSGHPTVMGYPGWLWTYGINYAQTQVDVATMYAGGPNAAALLASYGVDYVAIGPDELAGLTVNQDFFAQYPAIPLSDGTTLYKVR